MQQLRLNFNLTLYYLYNKINIKRKDKVRKRTNFTENVTKILILH